jgi:Cu+-exporting ATPase
MSTPTRPDADAVWPRSSAVWTGTRGPGPGSPGCTAPTGTIEKALVRQDGVDKVAVSLTHEQALVDCDPALISPEKILGTLRDIGYGLYDPRKLRPFGKETLCSSRERPGSTSDGC